MTTPRQTHWRQWRSSFLGWFDASAVEVADQSGASNINWLRTVLFIGMHVACLGVIWVGWSPVAVIAALALYLVRTFAITGFSHRYLSHRSFKTSRLTQFVFGVTGASSVQRGPSWRAAHHRQQHASTEQQDDPHSPAQQGLWWSHMGWFLTLGEGWHNNHHHYPAAARQGFYWWELDITYYLLRAMSALGLVWDLKPVPVERRESNQLEPSGRRFCK